MGEKATTLADAFAQRCTYWGAFLGALVWAPLLIGTGAISAAVDFTDDIFNLLLITLAFAPSVAVLTVGAGALLGAWIGVCFAPRTSKGYLPRRVSGAWSLAWRIAWRTFLYSTCGSGLGYLAMYLIYVIADRIS